jgi:5-methylcytosine-specific restriction endonuclease McrA
VKRAVWQRDVGRCAYVSTDGRRCSARARLEFDHAVPIARGGTARPENMRLLCRAHNQFEAQRAFGKTFMEAKRASAREVG